MGAYIYKGNEFGNGGIPQAKALSLGRGVRNSGFHKNWQVELRLIEEMADDHPKAGIRLNASLLHWHDFTELSRWCSANLINPLRKNSHYSESLPTKQQV